MRDTLIDKAQIIGRRINEWRKLKKWSVVEFARRMEIERTNAYGYFKGIHDPQKLFIKLREEGCDLHWLTDGIEEGNGDTPIITQEQAEMVGFLEGIGITYEDLRRIYNPDMTIEEFLKHFQSIQEKVRENAKQQEKKSKKESK